MGTALAVVLIFVAAFASAPLEQWLALQLSGAEPTEAELLPGRLDTFTGFLTFAAALTIPILLVTRLVHARPLRHLLGRTGRFDWPMFARAAAAFLTVMLAMFLVTALTEPEAIAREANLAARLPWLLLALPVIFCQSFAEDIAFKAYLTRTWGAVLPWPWIVSAAIAAVFTAGHAINDDVATDLSFNLMAFFAGEVVLIMIYLRAGNLAAATGLHWMNNVWSMCGVATKPGQSSALAMATYTDPDLMAGRSHIADPMAYLELIALYGLLWCLTMHPRSPFCLVRTDDRKAATAVTS